MIGVSHHGKIALLTLAHGKANTLDIEFCRAMAGEFVRLKKAPIEAVVITAQGGIFSAGVDLIRASQGGSKYLRNFLPALNKMYHEIFNFPKPVVAAVNGHAVAGGCLLACCADYRMMARGSGKIGVTELLVGLPFPALAFEMLRFVSGPRHFAELIYTGNTYAPEDALERGLLHEIVEPDALLERALASARMLADLSAPAFAQTKAQMRLAVTDRLKRDGKRVDAAVTKVWTSSKAIATINAYVARTLKK